jgi:cytochrome P450
VTLGAAPVVTLADYEAIRQALADPRLTRSFDGRSYEDGNIRDGVVSVSHGAVHRARRRVENTQFRADRLELYERELFPAVLQDLLGVLIEGPRMDLFAIGELLSVVLAAKRAGLDIDARDTATLHDLVRLVDVFSQGSAILDARDPDAVRAAVRAAYAEFEARYVRPAWVRREAALAAHAAGGDERAVPHDILTALLQHRRDPTLELEDDGRVVREVATYLQGGTHTSAQTVTNALDLVFAEPDGGRALLGRMAGDLGLAQRVVHETLRLRPTTPRIKRRAVEAMTLAGHDIEADTVVILDAATANRDPRLFGPDADRFDPDRALAPGVARWGLSFGAGPHQCPGRSVAGGFPVPPGPPDERHRFPVPPGPPDERHLYGLVALMLRDIAALEPRPDPERLPTRDTRTERHTRWASYPVLLGSPPA